MKRLAFLYLVFLSTISCAQTCEQFDRRLFHMLPKYVPDAINCKDSNGKKQGWWIFYRVDYNPTAIPDVLDSGNYVDSYLYGRYESDKKIGKWARVNNVHQIYELSADSFYFKKDTSGVSSFFLGGGYHYTELEYINDSTIINARNIFRKDTVSIYCDKNSGCKMIYHNKTVKKFSFADFETNFLTAFEQIRQINESNR